MQAGSLEIVMSANIARLADDMGKARSTVERATKGIEGAVASAKSALGALGIGIGLIGFANLIKGSIDAMDRLHDLSKTTNITVENLAGLQLAAKQSGGDLESIAQSINKLSQNMGKDSEKFRALGITAKEPLEAFKQLADIYTKLENPQQRAAVMAAALGKSWAGAAPLLSEGSAKIQEMVDKGTRLSGVTKEMTEQADALNDKWAELVGTGGLLTRMVGPMLPLLNMLADEMLRVSNSTNSTVTSMNPLTEILRVVVILGSDVSFVLQGIGREIGAIAAQMAVLGRMGTVTEWRGISDAVKEDAKRARAELDAFQARVMSIGLTGNAAPGGAMDMGGSGGIFGKGGKDDAAARAAKFLNDGKEAKDAEAREQAVRDAMHRVREAEDKRELDQITFQNQQKAALEAEALASYWAGREANEARLIAEGQRTLEYQRQNELEKQQATATFQNNLSGLMNTGSKEMFEIGKAASIATAVIKGYEAAVSSYAAGAKIGGPWVGAAFAAASVLATANMINNIRSQQFGGGAGGGGGGGIPIAPTQGASGIAPAANDGGRGQTTIIHMPPGAFVSRKAMRELLEMQNENSVDGSRTIVVDG